MLNSIRPNDPNHVNNPVKASAENISTAIKLLLENKNERLKMREGYEEVRRLLGIPGAYDRAAKLILQKTTHG